MKMSIVAASAIATALFMAAPAAAQMSSGSMSSDKGMKMSAADMRMMKSCKRMSHDKMMKNQKCMDMMRMHPDMMKSDGMMKKS